MDSLVFSRLTAKERPIGVAELLKRAIDEIKANDFEKALQTYLEAHAAGAEDVYLYNNIAALYDKKGEALKSLEWFERGYEKFPQSMEIKNNLFVMLQREAIRLSDAGDNEQAEKMLLRRIELDPDAPVVYRELGYFYSQCRRHLEALDFYLEAKARCGNVKLQLADLYNLMGMSYEALAQVPEALFCFCRSVQNQPDTAAAKTNAAVLFDKIGFSMDSIDIYERALKTGTWADMVKVNLASSYRECGDIKRAIAGYQEWIKARPDHYAMYTTYLLGANYSDMPSDFIASEHRKLNDIIIAAKGPARNRRDFVRNRNPDRQLRIGIFSPDLRLHSVTNFITPLIQRRNKDSVYVVCYYNGTSDDNVTRTLQAASDLFVPVSQMSHAQMARRVEEDQIDIIYDLAGCTAHNRIEMFAKRVAPIQISYLGYANTTGLATMDYRFGDAITDPEMWDHRWTEKMIRIPGGFLAYEPWFDPDKAPVLPRPNRPVTFGCYNNYAKCSDVVREAWLRILRLTPESKLLWKSKAMNDPRLREKMLAWFVDQGISMDRLDFRAQTMDVLPHIKSYNDIDIALDTFPYTGTTTTFEAMFMGVPVVTLSGDSHVSRVSHSIMHNIGAPELVARTVDEYVDIAVDLCHSVPRIVDYRNNLRSRMQKSPACDGDRVARFIETQYRIMFDEWLKETR